MSQEDFRLGEIGVVMLGVQDLARATAFYRDKLGLTVKSEIPGFTFLMGGGVLLSLSQPLARASERMVGATEVVFNVPSVRKAYEALRARGIAFTREPHNATGDFWVANFNDPEGHRLAIFGHEKS